VSDRKFVTYWKIRNFLQILHRSSRYDQKLSYNQTEIDIGAVKINLKSRDDIPKLLLGLQYIYTQPEIRLFVIFHGTGFVAQTAWPSPPSRETLAE
jgi:hypothetical protein